MYTYINNKLTKIGETIFGVSSDLSGMAYDQKKQQFRYYHKNQPEYKSYSDTTFFEVNKDGSVNQTETWSSGRSSGRADAMMSEKVLRDIASFK